MGFLRLKDLIKAIRGCKTAADERAVIQRESANIRTAFKEEFSETRHANNIAKLLYIHMLGYPAHFGQIECLKLVAGNRFSNKRLGYLGIMLLLDENQEVLTLVTNSLKNDMNHSNMYVVGLALCTLGNISSPEMARDLWAEVEKLLGSSNTYIRKKAALCAIRIIRKIPEIHENFVAKAKSLLSDRNHSVLLTGVTLITELCQHSPENLSLFRKAVPALVAHLKNLSSTGFSPEHDVSGVTDPFLQVKILRLLRILGKGDAAASEAMNNILAQVATNTEGAKNVGNAILYETVLTIMEIESDAGLRVLAINILGRFLSNRDNNIRYVALTTLNKTVTLDTNAVQRHRNIILDCLRDADISIRRRALDLSFSLINENNVRVLTRELLAFLEVADTEFKQGMVTSICAAAEKYAPNKRWHIDTVLRVLKLAGNFVRDEILSSFIRLVSQTADLHGYTAQKLYSSLKQDISQDALVLAGLWTMGEFGDILIQGGNYEEEDIIKEIREPDVVELIESILDGPYATLITREFAITCLMKLTTRFTDATVINRIKSRLSKYSTSIDVEVQQRAVEYSNLFQFDQIRTQVFERMPVPEIREPERLAPSPTRSDAGNALDLIGNTGPSRSTGGGGGGGAVDLLADIFGGGSSGSAAPTSAAPSSSMAGGDILSLLGGNGGSSAQSVQSSTAPSGSYTAYDNNGLKILLQPSKDSSTANVVNITATFYNTGHGGAIQELVFQAAVPKSQRLQMQPATSSTVPPGGSATQLLRVANPTKVPVRLRLKIAFTAGNGQRVDEIAEFSGFPESVC